MKFSDIATDLMLLNSTARPYNYKDSYMMWWGMQGREPGYPDSNYPNPYAADWFTGEQRSQSLTEMFKDRT